MNINSLFQQFLPHFSAQNLKRQAENDGSDAFLSSENRAIEDDIQFIKTLNNVQTDVKLQNLSSNTTNKNAVGNRDNKFF